MDSAWGWSTLFALALAVSCLMPGIAGYVGWWWVMGSPLPLVICLLAWLTMVRTNLSWRLAISAAVAAWSLVIIVISIHGLTSTADAQTQTIPNIPGNCNAIGNNNFNCSNITVAPSRLSLTEDMKAQLLANIPKSKPGFVDIYGPSLADLQVGQDFFEFLKQNGFNVQVGDRVAMPIPSPDKPLLLINPPNSKNWRLVVSPSAH